MRIALCALDDDKWGSLLEFLHMYEERNKGKVIIEQFTSKEAFAMQHAKEPFDIMICCFEGTDGLETIALAKRYNLGVKLIWVGDEQSYSPFGYRIHVVTYIDEHKVEQQLGDVLYSFREQDRFFVNQTEAELLQLRMC